MIRIAMVMAVSMMGCGHEPMWDLMVAQLPLANLPSYGQEITATDPRNCCTVIENATGYTTSTSTGVVVSATADGRVTRSNETPEMTNLYHLQVDSQEVFQDGAYVSWSNGSGVVIRSVRLQLYGIRGSL